MTKKMLLLLLLAGYSAVFADEYRINFMFSAIFKLDGRIHDNLMILNDDGRRIISRIRKATVRERNWLADGPKDSCFDMYMSVAEIDGVGKVLLLVREECQLYEETCVRGIVYLIKPDGKWQKGIFSKRTLGWGNTDGKIWGGYEFTLPCNAAKVEWRPLP